MERRNQAGRITAGCWADALHRVQRTVFAEICRKDNRKCFGQIGNRDMKRTVRKSEKWSAGGVPRMDQGLPVWNPAGKQIPAGETGVSGSRTNAG